MSWIIVVIACAWSDQSCGSVSFGSFDTLEACSERLVSFEAVLEREESFIYQGGCVEKRPPPTMPATVQPKPPENPA